MIGQVTSTSAGVTSPKLQPSNLAVDVKEAMIVQNLAFEGNLDAIFAGESLRLYTDPQDWKRIFVFVADAEWINGGKLHSEITLHQL